MKFKKFSVFVLLMMSSAVFADIGAYGILNIGQAYSHFSHADYGMNSNNGQDNWVYAAKVGVGYQIDDYFGLEASYLSLQDRTFNDLTPSTKGIVTEQAFDVLTVVQIPFIADLNIIGKIGSAYVNADQMVSLLNNEPDTVSPTARNIYTWRPEYAFGLGTDFGTNTKISVSYTRIPGDSDTHLPDLAFYSLGLVFGF